MRMSGSPRGCGRWPEPWPHCAPPPCAPNWPVRRPPERCFCRSCWPREDGSALSGGQTGDAPTLLLQTPAADGGPHREPRPRHSHRRPPRRGRWRSKALVGAAAAAVVIVGVALAGTFSGAGGPSGLLGHSPDVTSATTQPASTGPGANGLEGSATNEATGRTSGVSDGKQSSSGSGTEAGSGALCHQYWAFFSHPESSASVKGENDLLQQLSELAGGLWNVNRYCMAYAPGPGGPSAPESNPGGPDFQVPDGTQGSSGDNPPAQQGGNGSGGNGSGSGGNETGSGGHGSGTGSRGGSGGNGTGSGGRQRERRQWKGPGRERFWRRGAAIAVAARGPVSLRQGQQ